MRRIAVLALATLALSGCYYATVDTGATPSTVTIENRWAHGWLGGLVSPYTVETQQKCPKGVAKVTTQLSFANMVASFITGGIYTPMDITVVCAA